MRIPDDVLEAIRTRVSIVEVVGRHVALRRAGKNWKGLCPFHAEKTPSFVVNEERGTYHCFGCGAGGSAFRFVMEAEGRTFLDAVQVLAERAGVPLRTGPEDAGARRGREERQLLLVVLELACRYYRHQLNEGRAGEQARAYLERRQVPPEAAEAFRLGCAPEGWDPLARFLRSRGVDLELAAKAGLLAERASGGHYDRLRNRLVFPIADAGGRVVSFGGRVLGQGEPKYLNGPDSPVFRKGELLYGLGQAAETLRKDRRALVVEGYLDVISLHARGYSGALATLGTALTAEHVQGLRRRADEAVLVYDGDDAGRKAAFRSLEVFLAEGFPCRVVLLPRDHDPDSFVRQGGDLKALVAEARPLFEALLAEVADGAGSVEGKLAAVAQVVPRLAAVADPLARDLYLRRTAEVLAVDEALLRDRLGAGKGAPASGARAAPVSPPPQDPLERVVLEGLVHEPEHRRAFLARGADGWLRPGPLREAARYVAGRGEPAPLLPLDEAPEAVRRALTEVLVAEERPRHPFAQLEARLRLRTLEEEAARILAELRKAEAQGDRGAVLELLRRKAQADRDLEECRRSVAGRGL
ncbi:MAG: DNA primase [Deferrisomatales bacterium]